MTVLVSVVTSVYNCECYINEMINSVLNQSFQDWEMIIIDDASTDDTWNIINEYKDNRIIKFRNKKNRGLTYNLNKAISCAKGKYIIRIDGDDIAKYDRFEKQVQFMEKNKDVVLSGCWMKTIGLKKSIYKSILNEDAIKINLLFNAVVFHPTFIIRKSILDTFNIVYNEKLLYAQDYDLEFQLSNYGKIKNLSEILMYYRIHNSQVTIDKRQEQEEYANQTRKIILNKLDIFLNKEEFNCWNTFCLFKCHILKCQEINLLRGICNEIVKKNKIKNIYNSNLLENILFDRLLIFENECKKVENRETYKEKDIGTYYSHFLMMCQWINLKQTGKNLVSYFQEKNICSIAIYGIGEVGNLLVSELAGSNIEIKYGIDKNKETIYYEDRINIINPEENELDNVDAVIVTAISSFEKIKDNLRKKLDCPIISLSEIIFELL